MQSQLPNGYPDRKPRHKLLVLLVPDNSTRNISIIGIGGETSTSYVPAMRLMAANLRHLPFDHIVTHRMALDQAEKAVELAQTDDAMKIVLAPYG